MKEGHQENNSQELEGFREHFRKIVLKFGQVNKDVSGINPDKLGEKEMGAWLEYKKLTEQILILDIEDSDDKVKELIDEAIDWSNDISCVSKKDDVAKMSFMSLIRNRLQVLVACLGLWEVVDAQSRQREIIDKIKEDCDMFLS